MHRKRQSDRPLEAQPSFGHFDAVEDHGIEDIEVAVAKSPAPAHTGGNDEIPVFEREGEVKTQQGHVMEWRAGKRITPPRVRCAASESSYGCG